MRHLVALAGLILIAGIVGTFLTLVVYVLAALAALGLAVMLVGWVGEKVTWRQASKQIHATAAAVGKKAATLEDDRPEVMPEVMPEEMRHPAWARAIAERTEEHERLARRYADLRYRIGSLASGADYSNGYFDRTAKLRELNGDLANVETLVCETFGITRPTTIIIGLDNEIHGVDLAPPRDEVLHLRRRFSALTDCRYGHADTHNIVGVTGAAGIGKTMTNVVAGRIVRECAVCEPVTRWTENP